MPGVGALLAILLLVVGTVVFCVAMALAARAVDRLWDAVSPDEDAGRDTPPTRARTGVRRRPTRALPQPVQVGLLAALLIAALAWLAFTLGRTRALG